MSSPSRLSTDRVSLALRRGRLPSLPWLLAIIVGILLDDRLTIPIGLSLSIASSCFLAAPWLRDFDRQWRASGIVLLGWTAIAAGLHHAHWSLAPPDALTEYERIPDAMRKPLTARVVGTLEETPFIEHAEAEPFEAVQPEAGRTLAMLRTETLRLRLSGEAVPMDRRVRLQIRGHAPNLRVGDRIEVLGSLIVPSPPTNPNGFDFAHWLRERNATMLLIVDSPERVQTFDPPRGFAPLRSLRRFRESLRSRLRLGLETHLASRNASVAAALLLGSRDGLTKDDREAFIASGTMHLLAISGLHLGLLTGIVWLIPRGLGFSTRMTVGLLIGFLVGYASLVSPRPSVLRAALLLSMLLLSMLSGRRGAVSAMLTLTAAVLLLFDPRLLFDAGAQLSFAAVLGVLTGQRILSRWDRRPKSVRERLSALHALSASGRLRLGFQRLVIESIAIMAGVWLWTTPLVAWRFQIVSPIGIALNLLLLPVIGLLLGCGFGLLVAIVCCPPLAFLFAVPFDSGLSMLLGLVDASAMVGIGHWEVNSPPVWWLLGYFLLLAIGLLGTGSPLRRGAPIAMGTWLAVGLSAALWNAESPQQSTPDPLRITVLDVGHGSAILIECPDGTNLLYDAGAIDSATRVQRTVRAALAEARRPRLDVVIVSHADLDHYNGLLRLLEQVPVGTVWMSPATWRSDAPGIRRLTTLADANEIPVRTLAKGDVVPRPDGVRLTVLHPEWNAGYDTDNEGSLVLRIEYRGRSVLLTGDVERSGMTDLMGMESRSHDVLLAPHHGSAESNPQSFANWARPRDVIVSAGWSGVKTASLEEIYPPPTQLWRTNAMGAITVTIDETGELRIRPYRTGVME